MPPVFDDPVARGARPANPARPRRRGGRHQRSPQSGLSEKEIASAAAQPARAGRSADRRRSCRRAPHAHARGIDASKVNEVMPELLRVKGGLLLSTPQPSVDDAEMYFMKSLELSRRQAARGWELRTAVDLAALFAFQGRSERHRAEEQESPRGRGRHLGRAAWPHRHRVADGQWQAGDGAKAESVRCLRR
jgi:hypothetical protein